MLQMTTRSTWENILQKKHDIRKKGKKKNHKYVKRKRGKGAREREREEE